MEYNESKIEALWEILNLVYKNTGNLIVKDLTYIEGWSKCVSVGIWT